MSLKRLKLMRAAARVKRCHVMHSNHQQTVGEHTFGVIALIREVIAPRVPSSNLLLKALDHDATEAVRGDPPGPVLWWRDDIRKGYADMDKGIEDEYGLTKAELTEWEAQVLVFCDKFEFVLYALEEVDSGNIIFLPRAKGALTSIIQRGQHRCTPAAESAVVTANAMVVDRYSRMGNQLEGMTHGWPG